MTVSVSLPEYLCQWAANRFGSPVSPPKGSPIASFLRTFLRHKNDRPKSERPRKFETSLEIIVPSFPGRDPIYYNYLSPTAETQLRDLLRDLFDCQLFTDMNRFRDITTPSNELIYSWMDANGIKDDERNWLAIAKRLQILRRRASESYRKNLKRR